MIRWVLIFLLMASPCWGADVLTNFIGFESQSTLDAKSTSGSPTFQTSSPVITGASTLELVGSASTACIEYSTKFDSGGAATAVGDYNTIGFHYRATDVTPSSDTRIFQLRHTSDSNSDFSLFLETDGDLAVKNATEASTVLTITAPFSVDTNYYIEIKSFLNNSGNGEILIDGSSQGTYSSVDLLDSATSDRDLRFCGPGSGDGTYYFDNVYVLEDDADSTLPTPLANNSDGLEVFAYQNGEADQTPDTGYTSNDTTTDARNWDTGSDIPWVTTWGPTYTSSTADGGVVFNDTATNGHGPGPTSGAYTIDGTIVGGKWSWLLDRGNGGATTHTGWYGSNNDTPLTSFNFTDPDGDVLRAVVSEGALVPTSSETFAMGGGVSGAKDLFIEQMMAEILHLPPEAAATFPDTYYVTWLPEEERERKELEKLLTKGQNEKIHISSNTFIRD